MNESARQPLLRALLGLLAIAVAIGLLNALGALRLPAHADAALYRAVLIGSAACA